MSDTITTAPWTTTDEYKIMLEDLRPHAGAHPEAVRQWYRTVEAVYFTLRTKGGEAYSLLDLIADDRKERGL